MNWRESRVVEGYGRRRDLHPLHAHRVRKAAASQTLYGIEGQGWFLGVHSFTHYVKVAFFRGTSLRPVPPGASKSKDTRYIDIREGDELDEPQMATWVKQAAALPGWVPVDLSALPEREGEIPFYDRPHAPRATDAIHATIHRGPSGGGIVEAAGNRG